MQPKYPVAIRVIHWLMAIIIISLIAVGLLMDNAPDPLRGTLFFMHKSFGVLVLLLVVLRIFLRVRLGTPELPAAIPQVEKKMAHWGHYGLYVFMLGMPLSGILMNEFGGYPVPFFGLLTLPKLVDVDKAMGGFYHSLHVYGGYTLIAVLVGHIGAVGFHYIKERVNLLNRMI